MKKVDGNWKIDELIVHDGSVLSTITCGVSCCGAQSLLLGSQMGYGVLQCPYKQPQSQKDSTVKLDL